MSVPFIDLKRDILAHREDYLRATARVLDTGIFSLGPEVEAFERKFAQYLGVKHVVAVNGGTWALYAAMLALGIGAGDEVVLPTNTFIATAEAVVIAGATPVFCDVDQETHLIDLRSCEVALSERTKAIIPVHLYGRAVEMPVVIDWARQRGVYVVEDAAQAHGARIDGQRVGSFGDVGCFSFYPTKNLGALGEGGAVCTNNDKLAERLRAVRLHGITTVKYRHDILGTNLKMEALQGAYLSLKLDRLDAENGRRRDIADQYRQAFQKLPIDIPSDLGEAHVYHHFVCMLDRRDELMAHLQAENIGCGIYYPIPVHLQPAFRSWGRNEGSLPVAEVLSKRVLSLPMFSTLRDAEVADVIRAVGSFFAL